MKETGTFLPHAALALAVAIPIAAISAVVFSDDDADERAPCDGCGELFAPDELAAGDAATRWCPGCAAAGAPFDCIVEDDGEP